MMEGKQISTKQYREDKTFYDMCIMAQNENDKLRAELAELKQENEQLKDLLKAECVKCQWHHVEDRIRKGE